MKSNHRDSRDSRDSVSKHNRKMQLKLVDICYDFQNHHNCKRGNKCRFYHISSENSLCLEWIKGNCRRGRGCRFAHRYGYDIVEPKMKMNLGNNHNKTHKNNGKNNNNINTEKNQIQAKIDK